MRRLDWRQMCLSLGCVGAIAALVLAGPRPACAQAFPEKRPITLVVPFVAGGGTDAIARELGKHLQDKLGQTIVIDNRGGAGGVIAAQLVARAKPDGHTLLIVTSTFITSATGQQKLPYDVLADFTPIAWLGRGPMLLVVNRDLGIATVQQLIERARAQPDAFNFVSSGPGSVTHLAGELFVQRTGIKMTHIPYKGSGPATLDLIAGHGQVFFATVPTILGQIRADKVRLIAATSKERTTLFPDTPTIMEAGVRDYAVGTWWGIVGPPRLSEPVIATLNQAVNDAAASETMRKRFANEGAEPFRGSPGDFAALLQEELKNWRKVVDEGGLKFD